MKTVILCGGRGTRLDEETRTIPKPLIKIDKNPLLWHIMKLYSFHSFKKFVLCLGYKGEMIEKYSEGIDYWKIECPNTGIKTGTASRIKKIKDFVGEMFFLTYGDGLSNVDIKKVLEFHKSHGKIATVTAVPPLVRFGMLDIKDSMVKEFRKYSAPVDSWIDGGFFIFNRTIFDYLESSDEYEMLEAGPLENLAKDGQLTAYKHNGYWQCIDTYRDLLKVREDRMKVGSNWIVWE